MPRTATERAGLRTARSAGPVVPRAASVRFYALDATLCLLIEADSGGSNDYRKWEWKVALQALADETRLAITVTHFPPGASKWNPIDHRMFSLLSGNWAGVPLSSYETVLKFIRATRSSGGFRCRASLDRRQYEARHRVRPEEKAGVRLQRRKVLPQWNYTIKPHPRPAKGSSYC